MNPSTTGFGSPSLSSLSAPDGPSSPASCSPQSANATTPPLHPLVDGDVIDRDATFGEQLFNVAVGQAVPQVPANRDGDHFTREAEAGKRR